MLELTNEVPPDTNAEMQRFPFLLSGWEKRWDDGETKP